MSSSSTVVLITGANSGIGYATSKVIVSVSADYHVIMASRNVENGKTALAEIQASGGVQGSLSAIQLDVTDAVSIDAAVKHVADTFGRLDVLVNNAGVASRDPDLKTQFEQTFAANVIGPVTVTRAFEPLLFKSKNPYLIHVSSGLGSLGLASDPATPHYQAAYLVYRTSKAALNMIAVEDSKNYGKAGVKVFALCPGLVKSNLRGRAEEQVNAGGMAGDPATSGEFILKVIRGGRDSDVGKFVHKDGVYPW